jgi:hypothetical protein
MLRTCLRNPVTEENVLRLRCGPRMRSSKKVRRSWQVTMSVTPPAVTQVHVPANVGRGLSYHIASRATTIMRIATEGDPIHFWGLFPQYSCQQPAASFSASLVFSMAPAYCMEILIKCSNSIAQLWYSSHSELKISKSGRQVGLSINFRIHNRKLWSPRPHWTQDCHIPWPWSYAEHDCGCWSYSAFAFLSCVLGAHERSHQRTNRNGNP